MSALIAVTRDVSPSLADCELSFLDRAPIDIALAREQLNAYRQLLRALGARVIALPAEANFPDAVFVEDAAVVVDGVAVSTFPGAPSRRGEVASIAAALAPFRPIVPMRGPGTLDGGDVLHVGRTLYVGATARSSAEGIADLARAVAPHGYAVETIAVTGCLHLKSACSAIGRGTVLVNGDWADVRAIADVDFIDVDPSEPWTANAMVIGETVVLSSAFPATRARLEAKGFRVRTLDVSEFQKAEGGLSCLSILVEH